MSPEEPRTVAENKAPKDVEQEGLLTKEAFVAQVHRLTKRARAAGLHPIQTMAKAYLKQSAAILDGLLTSLANEDIPKKKRKRK